MTQHAEKVSMFTRQISDTRLSLQDWKIFTQNKYIKLQKISAKNKWFFAKNKCKSANMGSSTVQLHGI